MASNGWTHHPHFKATDVIDASVAQSRSLEVSDITHQAVKSSGLRGPEETVVLSFEFVVTGKSLSDISHLKMSSGTFKKHEACHRAYLTPCEGVCSTP